MNDTQWLFEAESLCKAKERSNEEKMLIARLVKSGLINLLGLNLMPVTEDLSPEEQAIFDKFGGSPEEGYRLRKAGEDEFIPFVLLAGREEVISEIIKKNKELIDQEKADEVKTSGNEMTPEELDALMAEDAKKFAEKTLESEEDVPEFITDPKDLEKFMKWKTTPGVDETMNELVEPLTDNSELFDDESIFAKSDRVKRRNKKAKVILKGID
ncbi:hypothetical protein N8Z24_00825 [bacterium]|nr:hypothetical protein [bacterium]